MDKKIITHRRFLGKLETSSIGFGCMGLSHGYGPCPSMEEGVKILHKAYEAGYTFFDTAEGYGLGENEKLVGMAFKDMRDKVEIATKFAIFDRMEDRFSIKEGTPLFTEEELEKIIREKLAKSLEHLQTNYVDLYYLHRVTPNYHIEDIAKVMKKLIEEKKIKYWGISECTEETLRKAHAICPVTAVQSEYSIMERKYEKDVIPACKELGIGFVPYGPLAAGYLSGRTLEQSKYVGDDVRRVITRYQADNITKNQPLIDYIKGFAEKKKCTMAQLSLAWIMKQHEFAVSIPGTKTEARLNENAGADKIEFTDEEFKEFDEGVRKFEIFGNRTDQDIMKLAPILKAEGMGMGINVK